MHKKLKEIYRIKINEVKNIIVDSLPNRILPVNKFKATLEKKESIGLIAEIKKASPSRGIIRDQFNVEKITREYNSLNVNAISVLTDQQFFQGHNDQLKTVKAIANCPVLRKDFIIDEAQILEAYSIGADIILLIVAILSEKELTFLINVAKQLGLEVLVEVHTPLEVDIALNSGAEIIGINNRDLDTFTVNLNNALNLAPMIPDGILKIAESGLHTFDDIKRVEQAGFNAVLIGEAFMTSDNIQQTYNKLFFNG